MSEVSYCIVFLELDNLASFSLSLVSFFSICLAVCRLILRAGRLCCGYQTLQPALSFLRLSAVSAFFLRFCVDAV